MGLLVKGKILGLLENPDDSGEWDRRGLVIGHVQSGKTANYIGLITKAADAGYKFIIVIAGIHNNLRKQTQQRIDEGFVGRDSTPDRKRKHVGVGILNKNRKFPVSLTNTNQDFTRQIANQLVADLQGFSYCLEAPNNYFGAQRVFIDEEKSQTILRTISDAENYIPLAHKTKDFPVMEIPPTLKRAIHIFILGKAIRLLRDQENKHASMMVNVSRFVNVQRQVKEIISHYLGILARSVRYNHSLPTAKALKDERMSELKKVYDEEFSASDQQWPYIQKVLCKAVDAVKVYLVNSRSDEALDYKSSEDNGEALTALAIGGLSLSRGLTLEGLMVSYMYRNTRMYDTLMQMARWFGYRAGYDDLCRVYLSEESQGWYEHIADATEELRHRVKQMQRDGLNPKQFGLYVRAHPDALTVTALNKMRYAETRPLLINLSGTLTETHIVPSATDITCQNQQLFKELYATLSASGVK